MTFNNVELFFILMTNCFIQNIFLIILFSLHANYYKFIVLKIEGMIFFNYFELSNIFFDKLNANSGNFISEIKTCDYEIRISSCFLCKTVLILIVIQS